jgi:hypothetical protein
MSEIHETGGSYENCRRPGVAILDMQMSKVPIISGYAVGCPIFLLSILIAKFLFTGSLKK